MRTFQKAVYGGYATDGLGCQMFFHDMSFVFDVSTPHKDTEIEWAGTGRIASSRPGVVVRYGVVL